MSSILEQKAETITMESLGDEVRYCFYFEFRYEESDLFEKEVRENWWRCKEILEEYIEYEGKYFTPVGVDILPYMYDEKEFLDEYQEEVEEMKTLFIPRMEDLFSFPIEIKMIVGIK